MILENFVIYEKEYEVMSTIFDTKYQTFLNLTVLVFTE